MSRLFFAVWLVLLSNVAVAQGSGQVVNSLPDGRTAAELGVAWWRWVANSPDSTDPLADEEGNLCGYGQAGPVWFLSGSYSTQKVVRRCRIPADRYIFFPVINMMLWDDAEGQSCAQLQNDVRVAIDTVRGLEVKIDGRPVPDLTQYRYATHACFSIPDDSDHYASDGYWVLLSPLAPGRHSIHFRGQIGDDGRTAEDFVQDIEYIIDVE